MLHSPLPRFVLLRGEGTALLLEQPATGLPVVLHWGADLGELTESDREQFSAAVSRQTAPGTLDAAWQVSILPQESDAGRAGPARSSPATARPSSRAGG